MKNFIIAIDGPAGSGKSTVSKEIAKILKIDYLDTGAMYRAITLKCLENNVDITDEDKVIEACRLSKVDFVNNSIYLDDRCVDEEIRENIISSNVSNIAKIQGVREILVKRQREIGLDKSVVLDGRDIGTCVFPNAKYKFYINASPEVRGKRRFDELFLKGAEVSLEEIIEDVKRRDFIDMTREASPLKKAEDAIEIDSSNMSVTEVANFIVSHITRRRCTPPLNKV